ncbi:hypothetical protein S40288_11295 [Stachybotrys chartarum IBT 40288]|nr:hypothetical protein S40288_11295 [Stachybotrys chartarum IBT 40288]
MYGTGTAHITVGDWGELCEKFGTRAILDADLDSRNGDLQPNHRIDRKPGPSPSFRTKGGDMGQGVGGKRQWKTPTGSHHLAAQQVPTGYLPATCTAGSTLPKQYLGTKQGNKRPATIHRRRRTRFRFCIMDFHSRCLSQNRPQRRETRLFYHHALVINSRFAHMQERKEAQDPNKHVRRVPESVGILMGLATTAQTRRTTKAARPATICRGTQSPCSKQEPLLAYVDFNERIPHVQPPSTCPNVSCSSHLSPYTRTCRPQQMGNQTRRLSLNGELVGLRPNQGMLNSAASWRRGHAFLGAALATADEPTLGRTWSLRHGKKAAIFHNLDPSLPSYLG